MHRVDNLNDKEVIDCLASGGIVVARTDTIYGVLARAEDELAVERVYRLKGRNPDKSPIVLLANRGQMFDEVTESVARVIDESWPGPTSIVAPSERAPVWLRRQNASVAYRLPDHDELRRLIGAVGPLIAPSANPEGALPARSVKEAHQYFRDRVDIYVDGGQVDDGAPSRLIRVSDNGDIERLR